MTPFDAEVSRIGRRRAIAFFLPRLAVGVVLLFACLSLIACASSPPRYKAYRLEVNQ